METTLIHDESKSVELPLLEEDTNQIYRLQVSPSEYKQAVNGM